MRLTELEPEFFKLGKCGEDYQRFSTRVAALVDAQGITFLCPKCLAASGGKDAHSIRVLFKGCNVPDDVWPRPGRWEVRGTGFEDLTLSPSIHLTGAGCGWHGFVRAGTITSC